MLALQAGQETALPLCSEYLVNLFCADNTNDGLVRFMQPSSMAASQVFYPRHHLACSGGDKDLL